MFSFIKQVLIVLLSLSSSLARDQTKCLFLNGKLCMVRPTLIDLSPFGFKCYPFMISLDKCTGCCNALSQKYLFQQKQKT